MGEPSWPACRSSSRRSRLAPSDGRRRGARSAGSSRPSDGAPARLVVYRRPLEARAKDPHDLEDLATLVLTDLVADLLGPAAPSRSTRTFPG